MYHVGLALQNEQGELVALIVSSSQVNQVDKLLEASWTNGISQASRVY